MISKCYWTIPEDFCIQAEIVNDTAIYKVYNGWGNISQRSKRLMPQTLSSFSRNGCYKITALQRKNNNIYVN